LQRITTKDRIPAIGDYNTVVWILGLEVGSTIIILDEDGREVELEIVGIIANSIFQGSLFIWDGYFDFLYPEHPGFDLFLMKWEPESENDDRNGGQGGGLDEVIREVEQVLAAFGFDAFRVDALVEENIQVENTYIVVFQVILGFGFLIGTLGFGLVVSRNVQERTRELGILRAIGTTKRMMMRSLLYEQSIVILAGITIGTVSGIIPSSVYLFQMHLDMKDWPWLHIFALLVISYVAAIGSALLPMMRIGGKTVTDALRFYE